MWAYLGEAVEPRFPGGDDDEAPFLEAGARTDYGPVGNDIRQHMTEHETLQAALRFGRDETVDGAIVYVHTNTLPEWVPIADEGRVVTTWSDGMREVLEALRDDAIGTEWSTADVADHPAVSITERQVRTHLHRLADDGYLAVTIDGCGFVWTDDGLCQVNDHGDVDLDPVDPDEVGEEESAEVTRMITYRWDFRTSAANRSPTTAADLGTGVEAVETVATNDGPPPNPGD